MSEIVYAVHTRACTYLLDDDGFCRWVLSRSGANTDDRCIGAQFVAALDLHSKGGLIGELRIGASALFIRSENGRFVLIRTKPIEHVEARGAEAGEGADAEQTEQPEEEPVVLPDHLAVAAVFDAPASSREPEPPSARVILQSPGHEAPPPAAGMVSPRTEPLPEPAVALPPPPARTFPKAPPRAFPEPPPRVPAEPPARAFPEPPPRAPTEVMRALPAEPPRAFPEPPARVRKRTVTEVLPSVPATPAAPAAVPRPFGARPTTEGLRPFPDPSGRMAARRSDPAQETQPLPPTGRLPAWPPMLAPPPPQAEMLPLGPARPQLPSAEELDAVDLEEVFEDDQVTSMEVTITMPLFRGDTGAGPVWRR